MKTKKYRIGKQPHFTTANVLLVEGDIVEVPADQLPGPGWTEVPHKTKATETEEPQEPVAPEDEGEDLEVGGVKLKKRAADRRL